MTAAASSRIVFRRNPRHLAAIQHEASKRVKVATKHVTNRMRVLLSHPGTGIQHRGMAFPSSKPGQPPALQTGKLQSQHFSYDPVFDGLDVVGGSGSPSKIAFWLQLGTVGTEPRPYMLQALIESRPEILRAFAGPGGGS